ncbi:MAG: hypothetical protein L7S48_03655 [Candidatus Poseidonia sp.]|nr:hypothetical protein [Poseidonia sp.]
MSDDSSIDGLVTLQERMVNLINQLSMPLVEVALVLQKHITALMTTLQEHLDAAQQSANANVVKPWPLDVEAADSSTNFPVEKVMKVVDSQRMDILETLIRVTLIEIDASIIEGLLALRSWEHLVRTQLALAKGPGQLFSPLDIPEDW